MPSFNLNIQNDELFFVEGELTFASINKKTPPAFDFLGKSKKIVLDLKQVTAADSAGLALIIEWIKHIERYNTKLVFKNIPQQLLILATLSGLDLNEYLTDATPN